MHRERERETHRAKNREAKKTRSQRKKKIEKKEKKRKRERERAWKRLVRPARLSSKPLFVLPNRGSTGGSARPHYITGSEALLPPSRPGEETHGPEQLCHGQQFWRAVLLASRSPQQPVRWSVNEPRKQQKGGSQEQVQ